MTKYLCILLVFAFGLTIRADQQQLFTFSDSLNNQQPFIEYSIPIEIAGEYLIISMDATSDDLDTLLYLLDSDGNILEELQAL